jgi:hypothetical protein
VSELRAACGMGSHADDDGVEDRLQGQGSGNDALGGAVGSPSPRIRGRLFRRDDGPVVLPPKKCLHSIIFCVRVDIHVGNHHASGWYSAMNITAKKVPPITIWGQQHPVTLCDTSRASRRLQYFPKRLFLAVWTKSGLCGLVPYVSTIDSSGHDRSEEVCVSCGKRSLRRHRHR